MVREMALTIVQGFFVCFDQTQKKADILDSNQNIRYIEMP